MAHGWNTSQFVRTYGKPRLTQKLGEDTLWYGDLVDDFDKFMAIEDVQQPTFISPEPVRSVTMHRNTVQKNKTNAAGLWSKHLQSTVTGYKSQRVDDSNKKKRLFKKAEMKNKNNNRINISFSSDSDSDVSSNLLKVTSRVISKPSKHSKRHFFLPRSQCSTPHQKSLFTGRKLFKGIPHKKNMKNNKLKSKNNLTSTSLCTPKLAKKLDYSTINGSNSKVKSVKKKKPFDQSVLLSNYCLPLASNKQNNSKTKLLKNATSQYRGTRKQLSNKTGKTNKGKKNMNPSSEKHSDWYYGVMDIFQSDISKKNVENHNISNVRRSKKEVSTKNTSSEDNYDCKFINKSIENESCDDYNVVEMSNRSIETPNTHDEDESKGSLYVSCQVNENKIIKNTDSSKCVHIDDMDVSVNNKSCVDRCSFNSCNSSQPSLCVTSFNNSDYLGQNDVELSSESLCDDVTNELFTDNLEVKSPNVLKQKENNEPSNFCVNFNLTQHQLAKNVSCQSINSDSVINSSSSDSESKIILDTTNIVSDMVFNDEIERYNQSPVSLEQKHGNNPNNYANPNQTLHNLAKNIDLQSGDGEFVIDTSDTESQIILDTTNNISDTSLNDELNNSNRSSNLSFNKSSYDRSILSDSNVCSFSSEENTTVIYKQINSNTIIENNLSFDDVQEQSIIPLKTINNCSNDEKPFNDKSLNNTFVSADSHFKDTSCIRTENQTTAEDRSHSACFTRNDNFDDECASNFFKNISRRKRYAGRFDCTVTLNSFSVETIYEEESQIQNSSQVYANCSKSITSRQNAPGVRLEPGKKWRRSLAIVRSYMGGNLDQTINPAENTVRGRKWIFTVDDVIRQQSICISADQISEQSILKNPIPKSNQRYSEKHSSENEIAKKYIFEKCKQKQPMSFESWLKPKIKKTWKKVGEGVYGEVFSYTRGKNSTVVKIIPIEGNTCINNERQKMMFEVYSEVLVAVELNKLFDKNGLNFAKSFCKLKNISCVEGKYPDYLIKLWKDYDNNTKDGSDNDNPSILPDSQMFMVLEMENGGVDVEHFVFNSATQALLAFIQIVFGLAVAEQQFNFEHRDLHIGNILVKKISMKTVPFKLNDEVFNIFSGGIKVTIIDFTLSRLTHCDKPVYNDLSKDPELFISDGEYQFDIYRFMKNETNDQWHQYKPKTNIFWLHYVLDKMITSVHYKCTSTTAHSNGLRQLIDIKNSILSFESVKHFAKSSFISDSFFK